MKPWEENGDYKNESTNLNINTKLCYSNTSSMSSKHQKSTIAGKSFQCLMIDSVTI